MSQISCFAGEHPVEPGFDSNPYYLFGSNDTVPCCIGPYNAAMANRKAKRDVLEMLLRYNSGR